MADELTILVTREDISVLKHGWLNDNVRNDILVLCEHLC